MEDLRLELEQKLANLKNQPFARTKLEERVRKVVQDYVRAGYEVSGELAEDGTLNVSIRRREMQTETEERLVKDWVNSDPCLHLHSNDYYDLVYNSVTKTIYIFKTASMDSFYAEVTREYVDKEWKDTYLFRLLLNVFDEHQGSA